MTSSPTTAPPHPLQEATTSTGEQRAAQRSKRMDRPISSPHRVQIATHANAMKPHAVVSRPSQPIREAAPRTTLQYRVHAMAPERVALDDDGRAPPSNASMKAAGEKERKEVRGGGRQAASASHRHPREREGRSGAGRGTCWIWGGAGPAWLARL